MSIFDDVTREQDMTALTRAEGPRRRERQAAREDGTPARLGHFQLLEPIGHGGMGTVYSAYDLRLDRKVAIKLLDTEAASPEHRLHRDQRLLREAQAMAKLSHPNVVPIYEVGLDEDRLFIAMEYVAGDTLSNWLKNGARTWRDIVGVFAQAGRGLAAAHDAGIIHRDFKPANVLVDGRRHVRVTDFGIAKVGSSIEGDASRDSDLAIDIAPSDITPPNPSTPLTEAGALVGTPAYMSPEQLRRQTVDARSDQWSFCVSLYEALFGKRPFSGRGKEYARQVTRGEIDKPDPKSQVPSWVTAIVTRGLSVEPDARFPSMVELVDALERDSGRRRKRIALGVVGVGAIAAIAAVVGWQIHGADAESACSGADAMFAGVWDDSVRAAVARSFAASGAPFADTSAHGVAAVLDRYRDDWTAMRTDACRATRVRGDQSEHVLDLRVACLDRRLDEARALTALLASPADTHTVENAVDAASSLTSLAGCADTAALLQPGADPTDPAQRAKRAELETRLAKLTAMLRLGRAKDALVPAGAVVADARATADPRVLAQALGVAGRLETSTGDLKAAEATLEEALHRARDTGDIELFAIATIDLAESLAAGGISTSREGLGVVRVAHAVVDTSRDPALPIRLLAAQGHLNLTLAHRELALPLLQQAADKCRKTLPNDRMLLLHVQQELASVLSFNRLHAEALAEYESLVASATKMLGALHPTTVAARLDRCRASAAAGEPERAPACYEPALADGDRVIGASSRGMLLARAYYGMTLVQLGKRAQAAKLYADALGHVPGDVWAEHWYVAADLARGLGAIELAQGNYKGALEHCTLALDNTEKQHRGLSDQTCVAEAQLGLGNPTAALAILEPLQWQTESPAMPDQVGPWRFAYARAVWAGRHDAKMARAIARRAREELEDTKQLDAWIAKLPRR